MGHPTFMYRLKDGKVESRIFDSDAIPRGWVDSPTKAMEKKSRRKKAAPKSFVDRLKERFSGNSR